MGMRKKGYALNWRMEMTRIKRMRGMKRMKTKRIIEWIHWRKRRGEGRGGWRRRPCCGER